MAHYENVVSYMYVSWHSNWFWYLYSFLLFFSLTKKSQLFANFLVSHNSTTNWLSNVRIFCCDLSYIVDVGIIAFLIFRFYIFSYVTFPCREWMNEWNNVYKTKQNKKLNSISFPCISRVSRVCHTVMYTYLNVQHPIFYISFYFIFFIQWKLYDICNVSHVTVNLKLANIMATKHTMNICISCTCACIFIQAHFTVKKKMQIHGRKRVAWDRHKSLCFESVDWSIYGSLFLLK